MTATPTPKPRSRDRKVGLVIVAAIVLAVGAVSAGYAVGVMPPSDAASAGANPSGTPERPAPETSEPVTPLPEPVEAPVSLVPADCSGIYSTDWSAAMGGLVLNPAWINEPGQPAVFATTDDNLIAVLQAADPLSCRWGSEGGGSDRFLVTNVTSLPGSQPAEVLARLGELGLSCYEELGGTRCIIEETDDNGFSGESHFVRDGVWIATRWMSVAPDGYTHDIVNTLWK